MSVIGYNVWRSSEEQKNGAIDMADANELAQTRKRAHAEAEAQAIIDKKEFDAEMARIDKIGSGTSSQELPAREAPPQPSSLTEHINGAFGLAFGERLPESFPLNNNGSSKFTPRLAPYEAAFATCRPDRVIYEISGSADIVFKDRIITDLKRRFGEGEAVGGVYTWQNDRQEINAMKYEDTFTVIYTDKTLSNAPISSVYGAPGGQ
jgi:hypothetical protein